MRARAYLDWNATAPLRPEARAAMIGAFDVFGNPSSVHSEGREARALVERARSKVAELVGAKNSEIVFTSGATEAASVLAHFEATIEETAHDALFAHNKNGSELYALGLANSETGVITEQPKKAENAWIVGGQTYKLVLLDVTQAVGRIPWSFAWSSADLAILSSHKLGGPNGVGALIVRQGVDVKPLLRGGGQELGRRSGTENVAAIAGFGAAASAALHELNRGTWDRVEKLRNILEKALVSEAKETIFVGKGMRRIPNTSCFATPGWRGETQVMQMDLAGFAVSSGSACSSGKVKTPRVLHAMGLSDEEAEGALRVSLGPTTKEEDVLRFSEAWLKQLKKARRRAA